jgi:hypothetical protein
VAFGLLARSARLLLVWWLLTCAQTAEAAEASCKATRAGARARVAVELADLLDRDLFRLVRLGLRGKVTVELRLVQRGRLFGSTLARAVVEARLVWSAEAQVLLLDERPVEGPPRLALERISLEVDAPADAELEVEVSARLQVVTAQSLGDVARWITGGDETKAERSAVTRNLLGAVADDLTRSASTSCPVRPQPPAQK